MQIHVSYIIYILHILYEWMRVGSILNTLSIEAKEYDIFFNSIFSVIYQKIVRKLLHNIKYNFIILNIIIFT